MTEKLFFSLDIGHSKIVSMVGKLGKQLSIIGIGSYVFKQRNYDFQMINGGFVCDIQKLAITILHVMQEAQKFAECSSSSIIVNVAGGNLHNKIINNERYIGSHKINTACLQELTDAQDITKFSTKYAILAQEVHEYLVDESYNVINPIGIKCNKIQSSVNIILADALAVANIQEVIAKNNIEIARIVPSGMLSSYSVLNDDERALGVCLLDIGAGTTDMVVYYNGLLRFIRSFPIGSEDITRDISAVFKLSRDIAEDLKLTYGNCVLDNTIAHPNIQLIDHRNLTITISKQLLTEVICARVQEILSLVKIHLIEYSLYDKIISGIVLTGGGANLKNLIAFASNTFNTNIKIGVPNYTGELADIVSDAKYAVCCGGLLMANHLYAQDYVGVKLSDYPFSALFARIKRLLS